MYASEITSFSKLQGFLPPKVWTFTVFDIPTFLLYVDVGSLFPPPPPPLLFQLHFCFLLGMCSCKQSCRLPAEMCDVRSSLKYAGNVKCFVRNRSHKAIHIFCNAFVASLRMQVGLVFVYSRCKFYCANLITLQVPHCRHTCVGLNHLPVRRHFKSILH
jgi:hypothetical protein